MKLEIDFHKAKIVLNETGVWLCLQLSFISRQPAREWVDSLSPDKKYSAILKERNDSKTLDQNGYYWKLISLLSAKLHIPPEEIYREHIRDIGGNYDVTPIKEERVEQWIANWKAKGIGWIAEDIGKSKFEGYHNVMNFYGSSVYTKEQMSRLLDICINDCKEQEIPTELMGERPNDLQN